MSNGPHTFHQFALLPPELRLIIWEYTLPPPRYWDIVREKWLTSKTEKPIQAPQALFINQESRSFAHEHYQWYLLRYKNDRDFVCACSDRDIAYLDLYANWSYLSQFGLLYEKKEPRRQSFGPPAPSFFFEDAVQTLRIHSWGYDDPRESDPAQIIELLELNDEKLPSLKTVIFLSDQ